jgi:hypothetical protein
MGHEDAVYLAKLAEQAERYEGMYSQIPTAPPNEPEADAPPRTQRWSRT